MTCSGSVFQMRAPATGKAREPMDVSGTVDQVVGSSGPSRAERDRVHICNHEPINQADMSDTMPACSIGRRPDRSAVTLSRCAYMFTHADAR